MSTQVRDGTGTLVTKRDVDDLIDYFEGGALTFVDVTVTSSTGQLLPADPNRNSVLIISADEANDVVYIDLAGGTIVPGRGYPLYAGGRIEIAGVPARGPLTMKGTAGQKLCVYTG